MRRIGKKYWVSMVKMIFIMTIFVMSCFVINSTIFSMEQQKLREEDLIQIKNNTLNSPNEVSEVKLVNNAPVLKVFSSPLGARVTLKGEVQITGETPFSVADIPSGKYKAFVSHKGYEHHSTNIEYIPTISSYISFDLKPKNRFLAGIRSIIVPGWGQYYSERSTSGLSFLIGGLTSASFLCGSGIYFYVKKEDYQNASDDYKELSKSFEARNSSSLEEARKKAERKNEIYKDAYNIVLVSGGVMAGIWTINFLEALIRYPDFKAVYKTLESNKMDISFRSSYPGKVDIQFVKKF